MTVGEYLTEQDIDIDEVTLQTDDGQIIDNPGCLICNCEVLNVDGNILIVR